MLTLDFTISQVPEMDPNFFNRMYTPPGSGSKRSDRMKVVLWYSEEGSVERALACMKNRAAKLSRESTPGNLDSKWLCGICNNHKQQNQLSEPKCMYCNKKYWGQTPALDVDRDKWNSDWDLRDRLGGGIAGGR